MAGTAQGRSQDSEAAQRGAAAATAGQPPNPLPVSKQHQNLHDDSASPKNAALQKPMPAESPDTAANDGQDGSQPSTEQLQNGPFNGEPSERGAEHHAGLAARIAVAGHAASQAAAGDQADSQAINRDKVGDNGGQGRMAPADDMQPDRLQARHAAGTADTDPTGQSKGRGSRSAGPHELSNDPNGHQQNDLWPNYRSSTEPAMSQDGGLSIGSMQQADSALEAFRRATGRRSRTKPYHLLIVAILKHQHHSCTQRS